MLSEALRLVTPTNTDVLKLEIATVVAEIVQDVDQLARERGARPLDDTTTDALIERLTCSVFGLAYVGHAAVTVFTESTGLDRLAVLKAIDESVPADE